MKFPNPFKKKTAVKPEKRAEKIKQIELHPMAFNYCFHIIKKWAVAFFQSLHITGMDRF